MDVIAKDIDVGQAIQQLRREVLQGSLYRFFIHFWPVVSSEELVLAPHHKVVCDEVQAVIERVIAREEKLHDLVINIPPGTSKSTMITVMAPVWSWTRDPTLQIITVSYAQPLALRHATDSREVIRSDQFQKLFGHIFELKRDEDAKGFYRNDKRGFRLATSTGSSITGSHAHIHFIDDAVDPKGAASEPKLLAVMDYIDKTLNSRKVKSSLTPTIMFGQRVAANDPPGEWLAKAEQGQKTIKHICLPATDDYDIKPAELKELYSDGLLDPVRLSRSALEEQKASLGSAGYAGQYGQSPRPSEGNRFKISWFTKVGIEQVPKFMRFDLWLDTAYTDDVKNDPAGFMVAGYHGATKTVYVLHAQSKHLTMPGLLAEVPSYCKSNGVSVNGQIRVEPKASGKSLVQMLRADNRITQAVLEIKSHLVQEGKHARAAEAEPRVEAGQVVLVKGAWNDHFIDQLCTFPNDRHDEYIDTLGYACNYYFTKRKSTGISQAN